MLNNRQPISTDFGWRLTRSVPIIRSFVFTSVPRSYDMVSHRCQGRTIADRCLPISIRALTDIGTDVEPPPTDTYRYWLGPNRYRYRCWTMANRYLPVSVGAQLQESYHGWYSRSQGKFILTNADKNVTTLQLLQGSPNLLLSGILQGAGTIYKQLITQGIG